MRARLMPVLSSWVLLWSLAACEQKAEPAPQPGEPGKALAGQPAAGDPGVKVTLLEAGAQPQRTLRYRFDSRAPVTMEMTMDMAMAIGMGQPNPTEVQLPPMKMFMVIQPEQIQPNGALRYTFRLDSTDVLPGDASDPSMRENLKAELKKTEGLSGWAVVDPRGFTLEADALVPPGASPQVKDMVDKMRQQMRQMSAPFPEEAVGVGARWQVSMPITTDMFRIDQVATYKLLKLEGDLIEMEVGVSQTAPAQDIKVPNLPTAKARLVAMSSTGSGSMRVALDRLVPESNVSSKTHLAMELRMSDQAAPQQVTTDMTLRLGLKAR
jgi:hypothetical protein